MTGKQIGWELKFCFLRARLNCQRIHKASRRDLQPLGLMGDSGFCTFSEVQRRVFQWLCTVARNLLL